VSARPARRRHSHWPLVRGLSMDDPIVADVHARIRQAFLLGLARQTAGNSAIACSDHELARAPSERLNLRCSRWRASGSASCRCRSLQSKPLNDAARPSARRPAADPAATGTPRASHALRAAPKKSLGPSIVQIAVRRIGAAGCRVASVRLAGNSRTSSGPTSKASASPSAPIWRWTTSGDDGDRNQYATSLFLRSHHRRQTGRPFQRRSGAHSL